MGIAEMLPRGFVNSVPKAGTNLVAAIIDELPVYKYRKTVLNHKLGRHPASWILQGAVARAEAGVGRPARVPLGAIAYMLRKVARGEYTSGHVPYQEQIGRLLESLDYRTILVVRDPRDVVVSQVWHVRRRPSHFLHGTFAGKSLKEQLSIAMTGIRGRDGIPVLLGIGEKFQRMLAWADRSHVLVLRFEGLVGPAGGGLQQNQTQAIQTLANHLGLTISAEEAAACGRTAFGRGSTFRRGQIGAWRDVFDDELSMLFKDHAAKWLIELDYERSDEW